MSCLNNGTITTTIYGNVVVEKLNDVLKSDYVTNTLLTTILWNYATRTKVDNINAKVTVIESDYITSTILATTLNDYVTNTSLATALNIYVTNTSLATTLSTTLNDYVTNTSLATTLNNFVLSTSLATILADYVTNTSLTTTLNNYVTNSSLTTSLTPLTNKTSGFNANGTELTVTKINNMTLGGGVVIGSAAPWIATIDSNGVTEVGRIIDFHTDYSNISADNTCRVTCSAANTLSIPNITATGNITSANINNINN